MPIHDMEEPVSTPKLPAPIFRAEKASRLDENVFSSSPGFGTPAYPIQPRGVKPAPPLPFALQLNGNNAQTILPILLPPQTLRPVAFRTLTKKHNLTITSSGLGALASFIGKFCGSRWREEGLAERTLDEIAKLWKRESGGLILDDGLDKKLKSILKLLEPCMSGGKVDTGRLSRTNSGLGSLSKETSHHGDRPTANREDSQSSLGLSALEMEDEMDNDEDLSQQDARMYLKVISCTSQPRLMYSTTKKSFESVGSTASVLPPIQRKIALFRDRYHIIHQRLLRNESFQTPSFTISKATPSFARTASNLTTIQHAYKISPISNLLGRSGSSHLLLGLLVHSAAGDLALSDLSGSIVLDMSVARDVPEDGAWFCPGMIVLAEGAYDEDGSNNSNLGTAGGVGGQIKGRFIVETIAGPPAERRDISLGTGQIQNGHGAQSITGAGFGWIDFLGVGSEKALGSRMRRLERKLLGQANNERDENLMRNRVIMIGECNLDSPRVLEAIKAILSSYTASGEVSERPLVVVMIGNFNSAASMAGSAKGGGSIEYKEHFDGLASVLSEFPTLLSTTTFVFVPGDNDPWASSFSAGAASLLPRQGVPDLYTSRVRKAFASANNELGRKETEMPGEALWASNPARISLFGPVEEIVLFRDDISSRLRRNAVMFSKTTDNDEDETNDNALDQSLETRSQRQPEPAMEFMDLDSDVHAATSNIPVSNISSSLGMTNSATITARKLVKTILDQAHLSPFSTSIRPVLWDWASTLSLYPLPTALVLADAEAPAFTITYEGCHVMNPGRVLDDLGARKGVAKWVEYDLSLRKGVIKELRF